jgi:hypothetical protein
MDEVGVLFYFREAVSEGGEWSLQLGGFFFLGKSTEKEARGYATPPRLADRCGHRHLLLAVLSLMASSGLSRRRAPANASATLTLDDEDRPPSAAPSSSLPTPAPSSPSESETNAGSAFAGGARVAYDPRDLLSEAGEDARVGGKLPRLTLMECKDYVKWNVPESHSAQPLDYPSHQT